MNFQPRLALICLFLLWAATGEAATSLRGVMFDPANGAVSPADGLVYNTATVNGLTSGSANVTQDIQWSGRISPTQIIGNQNNYNPAGLSSSTILRLNSDASRNITGLIGQKDGSIRLIINIGSFPIVFKNQDAGSLATNRFDFGADLVLGASQSVSVYYDSVSTRWRAQGSGGGDGDKGDITVTGGVWTIDAAVVTYAKMQNISATQRVLGRNSAGAGVTEELTVSQELDWIGTTQGSILYRGASFWTALGPGTSGQVLKTQGAGANPLWANAAGNVAGPGSSTAFAPALYADTTGQLLANAAFGTTPSATSTNFDFKGTVTADTLVATNGMIIRGSGATQLIMKDTDQSNTLALQSPTDITANYNITFPAAAGAGLWRSTIAGSTNETISRITDSAGFFSAINDETGSGGGGVVVGNNSPVINTPTLISPTMTSPTQSGSTLTGDTDIQNQIEVSGTITPTQIAGDQNNYNPSGLGTATVLRLSTDATRNITGLIGQKNGALKFLYNVGSFSLVLVNQNSSSIATNRFAINGDITLNPDQGTLFQYDLTAGRWRAIGGVGSSGSFEASDPDLDALAANSSNGLWTRTGAGTGSARTIIGTANQVTVSNGSGVSGNPTLSLPQDIATTSIPSFSDVILGHSTLTYAATTDIDFISEGFRTVTLTGNITFTTSNRAAGKSKAVRIIGDSVPRTLLFPAGWVFVGAAAPGTIAASKTGILTITCFGPNDSDVVAAYSVQP